ncbi:uncharacterized protein L3040_008800 [Drepanopeziza brunnea f. sp. 'multigermtubi']|nr:hypothetical protein L3040_008800 [Drepanopeziza brunnea f. sp. 'multigermtubi']
MGLQEALASLKTTCVDAVLQKWTELEEAYDQEVDASMPCFQAWILAPGRVLWPILRLVAELKYGGLYNSLHERSKKVLRTLIKRLHLEDYWALFLGLGDYFMLSRDALEILARITKNRPHTGFIELLNALHAGRMTRGTASLRGVSTDMSRFTTWDALKAEEILLGHTSLPTPHKSESIGRLEVAAEDGVLTGLTSAGDDNASDHDQSMEFQGAIETHLTSLRANDGSAEGGKHVDEADAAEEEDDGPGREEEEESHDDDHEQNLYGEEGGHGDSDWEVEVEIGRGNTKSPNPGNEDEFEISDLESPPAYLLTSRESSLVPSIQFPEPDPDSNLNAEPLVMEDSLVVDTQNNSGVGGTVWIGATPITPKDLLTVAGKNWLNDEVVNGLATLLLAGRQDIHCMSTFFFATLSGTKDTINYAKVEKWTKGVDIFTKKHLLVPINKDGNHWTLAIITMAPLTGGTASPFEICTVDSLNSVGGQSYALIANQLWTYLILEAKSKRGAVLSPDQVKWKHARNSPQQNNGQDCGVYMLVCLERFADDPEHFLHTMEQASAGSWVVDAASERARFQAMLLYQLQQATTSLKAVPETTSNSQHIGSEDGIYSSVSSTCLESPDSALGDACGSRDASPAPVGALPGPPASFSGEGSTMGSHQQSTSTKRVLVPDDSGGVPSATPSASKVGLTSPPEESIDQTVLPTISAAAHLGNTQNTADTLITQRLAMEHLAMNEAISLDRRQEALKSLPSHTYPVSCGQWAKIADIPALGDISTVLSTLDALQIAEHVDLLLVSSSQSPQKRYHEVSALEAQRLGSQLATQNARLTFAAHLVQVSQALLRTLESFHASQAEASKALQDQVLAEEAFRDNTMQEKQFDFYREKWMLDVEVRIKDLKGMCRQATDEEMNMLRLYERVLVVMRNSSRIKEVCEERLGGAMADVAGFLKKEEEEEQEWARRRRRGEQLKELLRTSQL